MTQLYDIIIEGQTVYNGLSEEEFFDTMSCLADQHYDWGESTSPLIQYKTYTKE